MHPESALFPFFATAAKRKSMLDAIEREFEGTLTYSSLTVSVLVNSSMFLEKVTLKQCWCKKFVLR